MTKIDATTLSLSIEGEDLGETREEILEELAGYMKTALGKHYCQHQTDDQTLTIELTSEKATNALLDLLKQEGFRVEDLR